MPLVLTDLMVQRIVADAAAKYMMELIRSGCQEIEGVGYEMALRSYYAAKYCKMPPDEATPLLTSREKETSEFISYYESQKEEPNDLH